MQFGILGPIEVRLADGAPIAVGGPQVRALVALLALDAGRVVSRDRLIDGLYGQEPPANAGHALQAQVSRLRGALRKAGHDEEVIESSAAGYRLAVAPGEVDAHRFVELAQDGRKAVHDKDFATAAVLLDEAARLWRGPALADIADAPFAAVQTVRLTEARLAALEDRAEAAVALGDHPTALDSLPEIVAAQPLRERARALLMRALYGAGRQADALTLFEQGRELLADELGTDPSAELAQAHLAILRADAAPERAVRRLPTPFTEFFGRDTELARVALLLAQSRLVTLTGPGGTGKTRLALAAGARTAGSVCFVDLAPLVDGAQVIQAVAAALGGRESSGHNPGEPRDIENRVRAVLAERPQLIVLDNCEHLILDTARLLHRLLLDCPGLRVLATSREPLRITGETVFPVGQLPVAAPDAEVDEQLDCAAVRLFADRAAAARPGFTVDATTIGDVLRVCARLDGLPLALELAAARLRTLDLDELDARLGDRFRLLARGDRTAEPRHRTLEAVVEWSWELLDPAERVLAQRFSVFAGGATARITRAICDIDDADELLDDLAEKSLVEVSGGRYRMLETIREFARRQAIAAGEHERLRDAHARYFTDLAEHADPLLRGADQLDWLARLAADDGNLQAALHWAARTDPALAQRLIAALTWYWWLNGRPGDAVEVAEHLLPQLDSASVEEYALCVSMAARAGGDSRAAIERAATLVSESRTSLRRPHVVFLLAIAGGMTTADPDRSRQLFGSDPWSRAFLRLGDGLGMRMSGRILDSEAEFRCALDGFRVTGDRWGIATALDQLAAVADRRGDRPAALALIDEAVQLYTELGTVDDTADLLNHRGDILAESDPGAARAAYERAAELSGSVGATDMRANAIRGLGDLERAGGDLSSARERYTAALNLVSEGPVGATEARTRALVGLGWVAVDEGDPAAGRATHRAAFELAYRRQLRPAAAAAVEGLAGVAAACGDAERAAKLLGAAETLRGLRSEGDGAVARLVVETRSALGESSFLAAYREGRECTPDKVAALIGE
ncbi:winged helix-turn-helix domain-containing protein [Nocardia sp. NBC_01503]|uniref:BTAD domain-containing putative transcriptional regulator n=1 Tax=Nocardia sp. NBC_01503 TaxID=2975997 RepID=UPI002E7B9F54|nr:BTAD domain-containing putative transcriptional regulator [Nocardia sp. NBC_01503]WTL35712.1 winged helix-turn-helix domain-containing protein [Nocardia sp. NBC_01503]